jgi:hypothetical protein
MKQTRIPKGFSVFIHADESVHIILDNYDGNFLAFQILILGIPLLIASVITAFNLSIAFFIFFPLLAAVVYWCLYNYKDISRFIFTREYFYVIEGLHGIEKMKVRPDEFLQTLKTKKNGKVLTSPRIYSSAKTKATYELYVITKKDKFLVTKHVGPAGRDYLDEAINAWAAKCS